MALILDRVSKRYGNHTVFQDLSCVIGKGLTGLLGPNGTGKSTLLKTLSTIIQPSSGAVTWNGTDLRREPNQLRRVLGYLPQDFGVYTHLSAREFLEYLAAAKGLAPDSQELTRLLTLVNLDGKTGRLSTFSGGMKRRLGIAQALLNNPEVLLLDEPTAGLDPEERLHFHDLISEISCDRVVILSTHIVSDIQTIASRILILLRGTIAYDGDQASLLRTVQGKVWIAEVPRENIKQFAAFHVTSSIVYQNNGAKVRVIAAERPKSSVQATPSIEDAYLWLTRRQDVAVRFDT